MRASITSLSRKLLSAVFAAALVVGLLPAAAFADVEDAQNASDEAIADGAGFGDSGRSDADASTSGLEDLSVGNEDEASDELDPTSSAGDIINEDMPLDPVVRAESSRSYFLAQTLESTRGVPMVSAKLPVGGDAADEVVGSFTYRGITYAVEPGGESVCVVAADPAKLPTDFLDARTIVLPSVVSSDGIDSYSVARIAEGAFSNMSIASMTHDGKGADVQARAETHVPQDGADPNTSDEDSNDPSSDAPVGHDLGAMDGSYPNAEDDAEGAGEELAEASTPSSAAANDEPADATEVDPLGITAITIPSSITTIEEGAFAGFETLQYVIVSSDNPNYSMYDGCLYDKPMTSLLLIPEGRPGAVRIAPSVTNVDPEVFSHCPLVDTIVADANSAAYAALEDVELYNAIGKHIMVATDHDDAPLNAVYDESLSVDQGKAFEFDIADKEAAYAPSNDIIKDIGDGFIGVEEGTTQVAIVSALNNDVSIRVVDVVVNALARPSAERDDKGEAIGTQNEGRINETVSLFGADASDSNAQAAVNINSQFEFTKTGEGTCSVQAAAGATLEGAIAVPMTGIPEGTNEVCVVTSVAGALDWSGTSTAGFSNQDKITSISLPSTITDIAPMAFDGCSSLASISLPDSAASTLTFGEFCFRRCSSLDELYLPRSAVVSGSTFQQSSLASVQVDSQNPRYTSLDGVLYSKAMDRLMFYPPNKPDLSFTVPSTVSIVDYGAFMTVRNVETLYIPASVIHIGNDAFTLSSVRNIYCYGMPALSDYMWHHATPHDGSLATVYCPEAAASSWRNLPRPPGNVIAFSTDIFRFVKTGDSTCSVAAAPGKTLEGAVVVPASVVGSRVVDPSGAPVTDASSTYQVTSVAGALDWSGTSTAGFSNQDKITSISLPSTITDIAPMAFDGCSSLASISLPDSAASTLTFGEFCFRRCSSLDELYLPRSAVVSGSTFQQSSLASVQVDSQNPRYTSLDGVLYSKAMDRLMFYPPNKPDLSFTVPSTVSIVDYGAFMTVRNVETLYIPASVIHIGNDAFTLSSVRNIYCYGMPALSDYMWHHATPHDGSLATVYCPEAAASSWRNLPRPPGNVIPILEGLAVNFLPNGENVQGVMGTVLTPSGSRVFVPKAPIRNGYTFDGWYQNADGSGGEFDFATPIMKNVTLYAKWTLNTYAITYNGSDLSSTVLGNPSTYTVEDAPFSLNGVERDGFVFKGWVVALTDAGQGNLHVVNNGEPDLTVTPGSLYTYGDLTITAELVPKTYKMEFDIGTLEGAAWKEGEDPNGVYDAVEYDSDVAFPTAIPVRSGWLFSSWVRTDEPDDAIYLAGQVVSKANFESEQDAVASFEAHWVKNLKVTVPLGSKDVDMAVSADLVDGAEFDVDKGEAEIVNLSDGELKVVSVREDASDADALAARRANALEAFGGASADASKLDAVSFVLRPTSDGTTADASKEEARFELFGSHTFETDSWRIAASTDPINGTDASTLRILYDLAFDYSKIAITDLKLNLDAKPISSLVYTVELVDQTEPSYSASA